MYALMIKNQENALLLRGKKIVHGIEFLEQTIVGKKYSLKKEERESNMSNIVAVQLMRIILISTIRKNAKHRQKL